VYLKASLIVEEYNLWPLKFYSKLASISHDGQIVHWNRIISRNCDHQNLKFNEFSSKFDLQCDFHSCSISPQCNCNSMMKWTIEPLCKFWS